MNRREFLQASALTLSAPFIQSASVNSRPSADPFEGGEYVGLVEFAPETSAPLGVPIGSELDERMYLDLSRLSEHSLSTPADEFYIRTGASQRLPEPAQWKVAMGGLVKQPVTVEMDALRRASRPMGLHLMECAGNGRLTHFGLISAASWEGVSLAEILGRVEPRPGVSHILVSGFDEYISPSLTSIPGASWIFQLEQLNIAGAFLATGMNGQPLTRDHGAPVRLIVPGWYGCACIKWLNNIAFVDEGAEATSQMREFASRTLQHGVPKLAKDYEPASIDHAAIPVRIEKWRVAGKLRYRVVGILWGGSQPVKTLQIRFRRDQGFQPIDGFRQTSNDPWTMWSFAWSPQQAGTYTIRMAVSDPSVPTRKLSSGYYDRSVSIAEV